MEIWRKKLIDPMEKRLVGHVLTAIAADREGRNSIPVDTVRGVIMSFVQVCKLNFLCSRSCICF